MSDEKLIPENANLDYGERSSVAGVHSAVHREKQEPMAGFQPISMIAVIVGGLVLMAGGAYLGAYNGGFDMDRVYAVNNYVAEARPALEGYEEVVDDRPWIDKWMGSGKEVYASCAACHQPHGNGQPGVFPPLVDSDWVTGGTNRLAAIMFPGLSGPITVKGSVYNGVMPPHGATFSDKQLAQVLTYVRNAWGNQGTVVTTEMVEFARGEYGSRTQPFTEAELLQIPGDAMLPGAEVDPQTGEPAGAEPAATDEAQADASGV